MRVGRGKQGKRIYVAFRQEDQGGEAWGEQEGDSLLWEESQYSQSMLENVMMKSITLYANNNNSNSNKRNGN